jgi:glutamate 5-kinase
MAAWSNALAAAGLKAAQILLTRDDLQGRRRHLAARNTLERILDLGAVAVVNENDSTSVDEISFGDNDVLSALVASLIKADLLVILSTIPGLMEDGGKGPLVPLVEEITPEISALAGGALNQRSTGGMITKLEAAKLATRSGCGTFIGSAAASCLLQDILHGTATGTFFLPSNLTLAARKRWIAFFERARGDLILDAGAVNALTARKTSLLAAGIRQCSGSFEPGAVVSLCDTAGSAFARGISTFAADEVRAILGLDSKAIRAQFPQRRRCEVVHRDSIVLLR